MKNPSYKFKDLLWDWFEIVSYDSRHNVTEFSKILDQYNFLLEEYEKKAFVAPVKVGDLIYIIYKGNIERRCIKKITIGKKDININAVLYKYKFYGCWCNRKFSTLNKTWWLTEEDARKHLERGAVR